MVMKVQSKTAVITGGSRGIGRAIALRLSREGANIGILNRQEALGRKVADEIKDLGHQAIAIPCDVTSYEQTKTAVAKIYREFGNIDILVNNAGIDKARFFLDTDETFWDVLISSNYKSFLIATHVCLTYMIEKKSGVIVSLGSDAGRVGTSGEVIYCGTKAAIMASSKALAREFARYNIRVNCVSPGPIQTDLLTGLYEGEKSKKIMQSVAELIPMKRIGNPEEVADAVAFFVSDDARYITGQVLSVDGGLTMIG